MRWFLPFAVGLALCGCSQGPSEDATKPEGAKKQPAQDEFVGWPKDNVARPSYSGSTERAAPSADGRECFFMVPDWAEPVDKFEVKGPKGSRVWFWLARRDEALRAKDEARVERLIKEGNGKNEILVVARPWRGWFGESNSPKTRLRVYALFSKDEALEIHAEWPQGSKEGLAEAEEVAAQLIYSVKAL